ncbi:uncharacterized protein LOC144648297 [Oculina patagonica]
MAENAENIDPSPTKRPRKPNFTAAECMLLLEVAEQHLDVIKSKFSSTITNKNKTKVWEEITERVNSLGVCKRTTLEVKEKWRGMVSNAKKEHNKCAAANRKTGGGKQPDSPRVTSYFPHRALGLWAPRGAIPAVVPQTLNRAVRVPKERSYTAKGKGKSPLPQRKRVSIDDINALHFSVLQKESKKKKLDIEIDNLLLKKREIMLRIQELEARAINPELNFLSC